MYKEREVIENGEWRMEDERDDLSFFPVFPIIIKVHRRVRQGELPKGQKKVPWGTTSAHRVNHLHMLYRRGAQCAPTAS